MKQSKPTCTECGKALYEYGYGIICPCCGTKLDVFPDSQVWLEFPGETRVGIGFAGEFAAADIILCLLKLLRKV